MTNCRCGVLPNAMNRCKNEQVFHLLQNWRKSSELTEKER